MRILICSSRNWFVLDPIVDDEHLVKLFSREEDLTFDAVCNFDPDYIFFPHWNWVVKSDIHERFNCIVFHTAPLPYGRGGSPIQNLILEGFKEAPVCAVKMTSKLDAGPVYASSNISLEGSLDAIFSRISDAVNSLILEIIGENPIPSEQSGEPHIFRRLTSNDNEIPAGLNIENVFDRIRMVDHGDYPKAFIIYGDLKIEFGNALLKGDSLEVACVIRELK